MNSIPLLYIICKYVLSICQLSFNFITDIFDHAEVLNFCMFKSVFSFLIQVVFALRKVSIIQDYKIFLLYSLLSWFFNILVLVA